MAEKRLVGGFHPALAQRIRDKARVLNLSDNGFLNDALEDLVTAMESPGLANVPPIITRYKKLVGESAAITPAIEALLNQLADGILDPQRQLLLLHLVDAVLINGFSATEQTIKTLVKFAKHDAFERPAEMYEGIEEIEGYEVVKDHVYNCYRLKNKQGVIGGRFQSVEEIRQLLQLPAQTSGPKTAARRRAARRHGSA